MATPSGGNLHDLEAKIAALEKANFDLKMQLFYRNEKEAENTSKIEADRADDLDDVNDSKWELMQLKEEQEYSRRRLKELEEEILQLQIIRDADIEKAAKSKPVNMVLIDENRRQEREAAAAIAAHDAAVIKQLQSEIFEIKRQHEIDKQLVNDCAQKLASQLQVIEEKDAMIFNLSGNVDELKKTVSEVLQVNNRTGGASVDGSQDSGNNGETSQGTNNSTPNKSGQQAGNGNVLFHGMDISHAYYRNEIDRLRNENDIMRDQLRTQREALNNQQEALLKVNRTTHEMRVHLESAEITRLQNELDKCLDEKEALVLRNQVLEGELTTARTELIEERMPRADQREKKDPAGETRAEEYLKTIEMYR